MCGYIEGGVALRFNLKPWEPLNSTWSFGCYFIFVQYKTFIFILCFTSVLNFLPKSLILKLKY